MESPSAGPAAGGCGRGAAVRRSAEAAAGLFAERPRQLRSPGLSDPSGVQPQSARLLATPRVRPLLGLAGAASGGALQSARSTSSTFRSPCGQAGARALASTPRGGKLPACAAGALDALAREVDRSTQRAEDWMGNLQPSERNLRLALRSPLPGSCLDSPREVQLMERQQQIEALQTLLDAAARRLPPGASVLEAGRRRLERIRGLPLPPLPVEEVVEQEAPPEERSVTPVQPEEEAAEPIPAASQEPILEFAERCYFSNSLGMQLLGDVYFRELEVLCCNLPGCRAGSVRALAAQLQSAADSEQKQAWAAFCWVCHHLRRAASEPEVEEAQREAAAAEEERPPLAAGAADGAGFAELFRGLCSEMGLRVELISGYARIHTAAIDGGLPHDWNALFLDGKRILVDCYMAAGVSRCMRPHFFGAQPAELAFTHHPLNAAWQLLAPPINRQCFSTQPYVRTDIFFEHGLAFCPEYRPSGTIKLGSSNAGFIDVKVPRSVEIVARVNGLEDTCYITDAQKGNEVDGVRLTLVGAKFLRAADADGKSDPYCVVNLSGKAGSEFKTRVIPNTSNPRWNEVFEVSGCCITDTFEFRVYDKDYGTKDDLLGFARLPVEQCVLAGRFDGDLELEDDGFAGSRLHVKVSAAGLATAAPSEECAEMVARVNFRVPRGGGQQHRLELWARGAGVAPATPFELACGLSVIARGDCAHYVEPLFPRVERAAFSAHRLAFPEMLPRGVLVLDDQGVVERRLFAPMEMQVVADVDGDAASAMVQRDKGSIVVWATCPAGEHTLTVSVREGNAGHFAPAVKFKLRGPEIAPSPWGGFPQLLGMFRHLGSYLEAPRSGTLAPGTHHFRLQVDEDLVARVVLQSGEGASEQPLLSRGDGLFEGTLTVRPPEALLLCTPSVGNFEPLARWLVPRAPGGG